MLTLKIEAVERKKMKRRLTEPLNNSGKYQNEQIAKRIAAIRCLDKHA